MKLLLLLLAWGAARTRGDVGVADEEVVVDDDADENEKVPPLAAAAAVQ